MNINYAAQYETALANAFPKVLRFGAMWRAGNATKYRKGNDGKTIYLPSIQTTGRVEGSRSSITGASQRHTNDWEPKILTNHRKWDTFVHPVDIMQTNMILTIKNITQAYNEQNKFMEMDCYFSSKVYTDWAALGGTAKTISLTVDNVLGYIDGEMEAMDEAFVPSVGRILYVTPAINTLIKNAKELQRYLAAKDSEISRTISRIEELTIEVIPSALMKTSYNFTTGAVPASGAKQINMIFVHPDAVLPVSTYTNAMISDPNALTEGKWVYFEEAFEDVFILNNRKSALAFHTEA